MRCDKPNCNSPIKPDITFFGEALPQSFSDACFTLKDNVDLLLIMGTALAVSPFNVLPQMAKHNVPKVLFNMENTNKTGGYDFTEPKSYKCFV